MRKNPKTKPAHLAIGRFCENWNDFFRSISRRRKFAHSLYYYTPIFRNVNLVRAAPDALRHFNFNIDACRQVQIA